MFQLLFKKVKINIIPQKNVENYWIAVNKYQEHHEHTADLKMVQIVINDGKFTFARHAFDIMYYINTIAEGYVRKVEFRF